jgi:hypothetical protein
VLGVEYDEGYVRMIRSMVARAPKSAASEREWQHLNEQHNEAGKPQYAYIHDDALEAEWIAETGSPFAAESVA